MHLQPVQEARPIADRIRRSHGRLARTAIASAKVTVDERRELEAAAKREGKALSEWAREMLLRRARRGSPDDAAFTEIIALRMFVNNVLRELATGKTMTPEAFAQVLSEVRANKVEAAQTVLSQYQTSKEPE